MRHPVFSSSGFSWRRATSHGAFLRRVFVRERDTCVMVNRPVHLNAYEFAVLSALRAQQLLAGCLPRLPGDHNAATMAQMEVADGQVTRLIAEATPPEAASGLDTPRAPGP